MRDANNHSDHELSSINRKVSSAPETPHRDYAAELDAIYAELRVPPANGGPLFSSEEVKHRLELFGKRNLIEWDQACEENSEIQDFLSRDPSMSDIARQLLGEDIFSVDTIAQFIKLNPANATRLLQDQEYRNDFINLYDMNSFTGELLIKYDARQLAAINADLAQYLADCPEDSRSRSIQREFVSNYIEKYQDYLSDPEILTPAINLFHQQFDHLDDYFPETIDLLFGHRGKRTKEDLVAFLHGVENLAADGEVDKIEYLDSYHWFHDLDSQKVQAYEQIVVPLINQNDPEITNIIDDKSSRSTAYGIYGLNDFAISALIFEINPCSLNELLCAEREIPSSDTHKYEQNRTDSYSLEISGLLPSRGFVHDNIPGAHNLLSAMLDFYDSRDNPELHATKQKQLKDVLDQLSKGSFSTYFNNFDRKIFDPSNYVHEVSIVDANTDFRKTGEVAKAADILRRLVENTKPSLLDKPHTRYPEINQLIDNLPTRLNEETGEIHTNWQQLGQLTEYLNRFMVHNQGRAGLGVSMVNVISYTERMMTSALKDISDKDWHELPYDPIFKEFVRFQELIGSNHSYDERKFENFYDDFIQTIGQDFESDETIRKAYRKLQSHVLDNLNSLASKYMQTDNTKFRVGALWSGNLAHELIGLADRKGMDIN